MVDNGDACSKRKDMLFVSHQQSRGTMVDSGDRWGKGKDMCFVNHQQSRGTMVDNGDACWQREGHGIC